MTTTTPSIRDRIAALDWAPMVKDLDSFGCTIVKSVLTREESRSLAALYQRDDIFRSTIVTEALEPLGSRLYNTQLCLRRTGENVGLQGNRNLSVVQKAAKTKGLIVSVYCIETLH